MSHKLYGSGFLRHSVNNKYYFYHALNTDRYGSIVYRMAKLNKKLISRWSERYAKIPVTA